jgi:hypothetical protein
MDDDPTKPPLTACPACGCREMFVRKDFPQKIGLTVVVVAALTFLALAASRRRFWIGATVLIAAAAIDLVLYLFVGKVTVCYRCRAEFRDMPVNPEHEGYELAVGEKYRQR